MDQNIVIGINKMSPGRTAVNSKQIVNNCYFISVNWFLCVYNNFLYYLSIQNENIFVIWQ